MLKNSIKYNFNSQIKKHEEVANLSKINHILKKEIKIDLFSTSISLIIIILSFLLDFPKNINQWLMKSGEAFALGIAVYAFMIGVSYGIKKRNFNRNKTSLEIESKRKKISLNKNIRKKTNLLIASIEKWAKLHKIKYKRTRHNHLREVIDFYNFPIDYIDINVINYKLFFTIRINDLYLLDKIASDLPRNCNNLILVIDKYHIGPKENLNIDEEGIINAKEIIIGSVLSKIYNTVYS